MADYSVSVLHGSDYKTAAWSGGTTTEIAISPEKSIYADRDFVWRISSATLDLEESDFTSLPDYNRIIMTLKGGIRLSHNKGEWMEFSEFTPHFFDGGDETSSVGKVVDFNLMTRKGVCEGDASACLIKAGEEKNLDKLLKGGVQKYEQVVLYCYKGNLTVTLEDGKEYELGSNDSLKLAGSFEHASWTGKAAADTAVVIAAVHSL